MDPNACLARFLDACRDGNREEAEQALVDLRGWIAGGGFLPTDPRPPPEPPELVEDTPIAQAIAEHIEYLASAFAPGEVFSTDPDDVAASVEELTDAVEVTGQQVLDALPAAVAKLRAKHPKIRTAKAGGHILWIDH